MEAPNEHPQGQQNSFDDDFSTSGSTVSSAVREEPPPDLFSPDYTPDSSTEKKQSKEDFYEYQKQRHREQDNARQQEKNQREDKQKHLDDQREAEKKSREEKEKKLNEENRLRNARQEFSMAINNAFAFGGAGLIPIASIDFTHIALSLVHSINRSADYIQKASAAIVRPVEAVPTNQEETVSDTIAKNAVDATTHSYTTSKAQGTKPQMLQEIPAVDRMFTVLVVSKFLRDEKLEKNADQTIKYILQAADEIGNKKSIELITEYSKQRERGASPSESREYLLSQAYGISKLDPKYPQISHELKRIYKESTPNPSIAAGVLSVTTMRKVSVENYQATQVQKVAEKLNLFKPVDQSKKDSKKFTSDPIVTRPTEQYHQQQY